MPLPPSAPTARSIATSGSGAGVSPVLLSAPSSSIESTHSLLLSLTTGGLDSSTFTLAATCANTHCGTFSGLLYTAPSVAQPTPISIIASSTRADVSSNILQILVVPQPPMVTSVSPSTLVSGTTTAVTIQGSGFTSSSSFAVTSELNNGNAWLSNVRFTSATTATAEIGIPSGSLGGLMLSITGQNISASSPSAVITVVLPNPGSGTGLPVFHISDYYASGSTLAYQCSGTHGEVTLTCTEPVTGLSALQGVRVVGGGLPTMTPPLTVQPQVSQQGVGIAGTHTYCYLAFTHDALGGVSAPSPQSCVADEGTLSYRGIFNTFTYTYNGPQTAPLWYVSEDGGPFVFLCVGCTMDVGQRPTASEGWPALLSSDPSTFSKSEDLFSTVLSVTGNIIVLSSPLQADVSETLVDHDDTVAIENAILAAVTVGGGIIDFGPGSFNIRKPSFIYVQNNSVAYPNYTTNYALSPYWAGYWYLYIPNGSAGNIYLEGSGASTLINTPPASGAVAAVLGLGNFGRPSFAPYTSHRMLPIDKGSTTVELATPTDVGTIAAGDDVWLYSGSYSYTPGGCTDNSGTAGGMCHFSELNTVTAVNGSTLTLKYPASKNYWDDGYDSFGIVKMPVTPHNVAIEHMTLNSSDPLTGTGLVYGQLVNDVHITGDVSHGPFGGGFKRDVLIENSSWTFGVGDASWSATDEYDQFTNISFIHNVITGYAAPGAEGPSLMARMYLTEGTSEVLFQDNVINNASIYSQSATDVAIYSNQFSDGVVNIGDSYNPFNAPLVSAAIADASFQSFASQMSASISGNAFVCDTSFTPPFVIRLGHYGAGDISNNLISYAAKQSIPVVVSGGGTIRGNVLSITGAASAIGIAAIPDESHTFAPALFDIESNSITGGTAQTGIRVVNAGFTDPAPVCIEGNSFDTSSGSQMVADKGAASDMIVSAAANGALCD